MILTPFRQYLLVRPSPSLRIIFVSPALRIPGLSQSHFLSHIGGPSHIRDGISDAFAGGVPVTAKVNWQPNGRHSEDGYGSDVSSSDRGHSSTQVNGNSDGNGPSRPSGGPATTNQSYQQRQGKIRWLNCTPLLGSDDRVGVWMVVMVEDERVTGSLGSRSQAAERDRRCIENTGSKALNSRGEWSGHHFHRKNLASKDGGSGSYSDAESGLVGKRHGVQGDRMMTL